jgi:hypothetical protein
LFYVLKGPIVSRYLNWRKTISPSCSIVLIDACCLAKIITR